MSSGSYRGFICRVFTVARPVSFAQQYNVHVPQVSAAIVLSTAISVFTISFLLIWLRAG